MAVTRHMTPIQLAFLLFLVCRMFSPPWLYAVLLLFSHDQSSWSCPSFSIITFHDFQGISDLLLEASKWRDSEFIKLKFHCLFLEADSVYSLNCSYIYTINCWWRMYTYLLCCLKSSNYGNHGFHNFYVILNTKNYVIFLCANNCMQ
jgi:hypothetical protein